MIDTLNYGYDTAFFAAANGYSGFRSLFGEIFRSESYEHIFVLKGGPGTGKSTLMKGLLKHAGKRCARTAIFCSSDPDSLDGVILEHNGRRVAVLDGTAPHERDAVIPGAIDEIINLGEGFRIELLSERREEILRLNEYKKIAYKRAYSYLHATGCVWNVKRDIFPDSACYIEAENEAAGYLKEVSNAENGAIRCLYTSSFGRRGYYKLEQNEQQTEGEQKREIHLSGGYEKEQKIMGILARELDKSHLAATVHLSPLDSSVIEKIEVANYVFIAEDLPTSSADNYASEQERELCDIHRRLLDMAKLQFELASEHHFALEDIYKSAVDFSVNDHIFEKLAKNIDLFLYR